MHPDIAQRRQTVSREKISLHDAEIEKNLRTLIELCKSQNASKIVDLGRVARKLDQYALLLNKLDPLSSEGRQLRRDLKEGVEQLKLVLQEKLHE